MKDPAAQRVKLSTGELWDSLRRQLLFLKNSLGAVHDGQEDEAVRVAVAVRVLLHDTRNSTSLLRQLSVKDELRFLNTQALPLFQLGGEDEHGDEVWLDSPTGLAVWAGTPARWVAPGPDAPHDRPRQEFEAWWTSKVIPLADGDGVSRCDLVDFMAHQDGGAHVDPRGVDVRYHHLVVSGGDVIFLGQLPTAELPEQLDLSTFAPPQGNAAAATMAQIGYELVVTLGESTSTRHLFAQGQDTAAPT